MSKMSNEEKTLRVMVAKPIIGAKILPKLLDDLHEISNKVGLDFPEFMLVFSIDFLRTCIQTGKEVGYATDIDALCEALKKECNEEEK